MATVRIDLPERQAAVLRAKATAQGLSLEDCFKKLAEQEAQAGQRGGSKGRYRLAELMQQCDPGAARSIEENEWPDDSSAGREAL